MTLYHCGCGFRTDDRSEAEVHADQTGHIVTESHSGKIIPNPEREKRKNDEHANH